MKEANSESEKDYSEVFVGRGPGTKVADTRCSRKQLSMVADTQKCRLHYQGVKIVSFSIGFH